MILNALTPGYPKLKDFISTKLYGRAVNTKKTWDAFLKYSELTDKQAKDALTDGKLPRLNIETMPGSNGRFHGSADANAIALAKEVADKFETVPNDAAWQLLVESTVLHELVHWGDWKDGKDQPGEEGKAFERAAYGKDINRPPEHTSTAASPTGAVLIGMLPSLGLVGLAGALFLSSKNSCGTPSCKK
ncbi:MAG: hypothetical protein GVY13_15165 [Alphaproteobacteria bacterium]|jgi:hypothetical protein|nr:hypothetical protein [Alphaproteobacteria bacterium]